MDSISQTSFLTVPRKKNKKNYKNPFDDITEDKVYQSYKELWSSLEDKLEDVYENVSRKFITDITDYIQSYKYSKKLIPALTLLTGINLSDHDDLFQLIKQKIKVVIKCPIVFVQSSHETSVKSVIEQMVQNFMSDSDEHRNDEDDSDDEPIQHVLKKQKKSACTLSRLQLWYESQQTNENNQFPLIIVIPHVESFSGKLLDVFLNNLSVYKKQIPFIVILGIATNLNALHQKVSQPVLQNYEFPLFKSQPSLLFLDNVLEQVFLTADCPFQLHGDVLDELIDKFTYYNFSVKFFIRGIQFCVMNHFLKANCNILCCSFKRISEMVKSLNTEQVNSLLLLPSVGLLNTSRKTEGLPILSNTTNVKSEIEKYMKELHNRLSKFHLAVRCFHIIVKSLPGTHFNRSMLNIYCEAMRTNITKSDEFKKCMQQFKILSVDKIIANIDAIEKILYTHREDNKIAKTLNELIKFRRNLESSDNECKIRSPRKRQISPVRSPIKVKISPHKTAEKVSMNSTEISKVSIQLNGSPNIPDSPNNLLDMPVSSPQITFEKTPSSRGELLKKLRESACKEQRPLSRWDQVKQDFVQFLRENFFEVLLECPTRYPFHEVLMYKNVDYLKKKYTSINQRGLLNRALSDPHSILECNCCKLKVSDDFPETLPDLCIAYKIFLEHGDDINLNDWLQNFNAKLMGIESEEIDPEIYNRFMQTVKELQLLGFIVPNRRKVNYVKKIK